MFVSFSSHSLMSPLPMNGCKFWPMFGTYGHEVLKSMPHLLWHGSSVYNGHLWGPMMTHLMPSIWQWSCHYTCFNDLDLSQLRFEHPTSRLQGKGSNPLCHHPSKFLWKQYFFFCYTNTMYLFILLYIPIFHSNCSQGRYWQIYGLISITCIH